MQKDFVWGLTSKRVALAAFIAVAVLVTAISLSHGTAPAQVAATTGSSVADECQAALGYPARSAADVAWLQQCVSALTPPTVVPTSVPPTATGTPSPTTTPTISPTQTVPPTVPASTTPPATTTPPTGTLTGCISHPGACGFPDASTAGAHGVLTPFTGSLTFATSNAVIHDVSIAGCPIIKGTNVTFHNVAITCTQQGYAVDTQGPAYSGGRFVADHVTLICASSMHGGTAFGEAHVTVQWSDISGCENGGDADGEFTMDHNYIHGMFLGDSVAPDPHTDGIQVWPGAPNIIYTNNSVLMQGANATFTSGRPDASHGQSQLTITGNLLIGGNYEVYWSSNKGTLANNRFGDLGGWNASHTILFAPFGYCDGCGTATQSGNVLDSTNEAIHV